MGISEFPREDFMNKPKIIFRFYELIKSSDTSKKSSEKNQY